MNLEEMKDRWAATGAEADAAISGETIEKAIANGYRRRIWRVVVPEVLFALVYLYFVTLIVAFFGQLDTEFTAALGAIMVVVLLALPLLRLFLLYRLMRLSPGGRGYDRNPREFARYRVRYLLLRRVQGGLGFLFLVALIVLTTRIYNEAAVVHSHLLWVAVFSIGLLGVYAANTFLLRRSRRELEAARQQLAELTEG